ncbi:unnamed protein product, partial [Closterium sp. NIES-53]
STACPVSRCYSRPLHYLVLLLTMDRLEFLRSVVSLSRVLCRLSLVLRHLSLVPRCVSALFALVVVFRIRVLLLSLALTLCHCVLPLLHSVSLCRLLLRPLFLTVRNGSLTPFVLLVLLSRAFWPLLSLTLCLSPLMRCS